MTGDLTDRPFLSVEEAAELLGVSHSTVTTAIRVGKLPAIQLGESHRATRIRRADLLPDPNAAADLRLRRIKRLAAAARRAGERETAARASWDDARRTAEAARQALDDELALDEIDAALRRHAS